jgi:hypothetical protein
LLDLFSQGLADEGLDTWEPMALEVPKTCTAL